MNVYFLIYNDKLRWNIAKTILFFTTFSMLVSYNLTLTFSETSVDELCEIASTQLRNIESIKFRFTSGGYYDYCFYQQGDLFRSEAYKVKEFANPFDNDGRNFINSHAKLSKDEYETVTTYDGKEYYQGIGITLKSLGYGQKIKDSLNSHLALTENPLLLPLLPIMGNVEPYSWGRVCNKQVWQHEFRKATFIDECLILDQPCLHYSLDRKLVKTEIWLSKNYSYYPLKWESISKETGKSVSGGYVTSYKIINLQDMQTNLLIPLGVIFEQPGLHENRVSKIIDGTLQVNVPIDYDLFVLTPTAETIDHVDFDEIAKQDLGQRIPLSKISSKVWWFRGILMFAGIALIIYACYRICIER